MDDIRYAIKYKVVKLDKENFLLFPISLVVGEEKDDGFATDKEIIPYCFGKADLKNRYVVESIYTEEELRTIYSYEGEDLKFLSEYFYEDLSETIMLINTKEINTTGYMMRNIIDLKVIYEEDNNLIYYMDESIPSLVMNEKALDELLNSEDLSEVRLLLQKYRRMLGTLKKYYDSKGVTRISVSDGKLDYIETKGSIDSSIQSELNKKGESNIVISHDISYQGLRDYIKERIFGHEDEIDTFSQKLYMNYTAEEGESIESILFVGPTGTGKTETVRAACSYLGIPMYETNASNIVPQGIKGISIEDVIIGLYENAGCDIKKAQRGLVFLDEFDKLNDSELDIKTAMKNILLTFTAGGSFPVSTDHYNFNFDSKMTNKIYAGVFERISDKQNPMGFAASKNMIGNLGTDEEIRKKIIDKKYFSQEELTRISTILGYNDLSRATKKRILMESKLSEFANKRDRYKRQFGIELIADDSYIDTILDSLGLKSPGMRSVNNYVKRTINEAEKAILENETKGYKKLVLTKDTALDPKKFDLSN